MKLRAAHYRTGASWEFTFERGKVAGRTKVRGRTDLLFGPGFFDLQCNGYAGIDFNNPEVTPAEVRSAIRDMWRHGCTHVLPTVVTHQPERLEALFRVLAAGVEEDETGESVPGFHLEGPFISPVDGARGAHPLHGVRPVSVPLWRRLQRASGWRIALVTVAPEVRGAIRFIAQLRSEGILPAIGHTLATFEQVRAAAAAGALLSTHLGNGCPQLLPRHANPILAQLSCDELSASLIPDGIHLPAEVLRVMCRAKGVERIIVVTDAMSAAGAPAGRYRLADLELEVGADRIVRQPGSPNFAGSALTMDRAVTILSQASGLSIADAWDAASLKPWQLLHRARGTRSPRDWPGLVIARPAADGLEIQATLRGRRVLWALQQGENA